jgi:hypothetical protein
VTGTRGRGYQDGGSLLAQFSFPIGICMDLDGNVVVADTYNHRIRKITQRGWVSTLAGTGVEGHLDVDTVGLEIHLKLILRSYFHTCGAGTGGSGIGWSAAMRKREGNFALVSRAGCDSTSKTTSRHQAGLLCSSRSSIEHPLSWSDGHSKNTLRRGWLSLAALTASL